MPPIHYKTCDLCRKRKIKCIPIEPTATSSVSTSTSTSTSTAHPTESPCTSCTKLRMECTFGHVYGRPGRPTGSKSSALPQRPNPGKSDPYPNHPSSSPQQNFLPPNPETSGYFTGFGSEGDLTSWTGLGLGMGSIFGGEDAGPSNSNLSPTHLTGYGDQPLNRNSDLDSLPQSHYTSHSNSHTTSYLDSHSHSQPLFPSEAMHDQTRATLPRQSTSSTASASTLPMGLTQNQSQNQNHNQTQTQNHVQNQDHSHQHPHPHPHPHSHPQHRPPSNTHTQTNRNILETHEADFQLEEIVPWSTMSFFLGLYLAYLHSLLPLVHRPSFAQDLTMRRDRGDREFRGFLLGLAAYTIAQSPLSRMQATFPRSQLEAFQHKFHRASMLLLDRSFRGPGIAQIGTLITGYFYCQSVGKSNRAAIMLAEACQLCHLMRMHDERHVQSLGLSFVDVQIWRRVFWHVYAVDITEASSGHMIHLNSFEGFPQLPLEIDDELITFQGAFDQPPSQQSYMCGFVSCIRLFPILEECLVRHRRLVTGLLRNGGDKGLTKHERDNEMHWVADAEGQVDEVMTGLPDCLRDGVEDRKEGDTHAAVMGMQRANLSITAVSVRFALYEYKASLGNDISNPSIADERATLGRQAYRALSAIPFDDLAANGESIRGKIFRILIALLNCNEDSADWAAILQDWWNIFNQIHFVQLVAANVDSRLPSPAHSPR